jgi:hypothetical protein
MIYTIEQYNTLKAAIAEGALKVEYSDKKVEYRSLKDMKEILRDMENELGLTCNNNGGRKYAMFSKGIDNGCSDNDRWIS